jgi:hypothetical protein
MFGYIRVALRFFVVGFVLGALFAPRAGADTRAMLREKLTTIANQVLELAALPPIEPSRATNNGGASAQARRTRGTHGPSSRPTS